MKNRLIDNETRRKYQYSDMWNERRQSGRTLGIAYRTIGEAFGLPGKQIPITDHNPTIRSNKYLAEVIIGIIRKNGLKFVDIYYKGKGKPDERIYLIYNIFETEVSHEF